MKIYRKAILPSGFLANAVYAGIKKKKDLDLALFYSKEPAKAVCLFTSNRLPCAPIKINRENLKKNVFFRAVLANSGNANAFTAKQGIADVLQINKDLAKILRIKKESILVASTGIIGRRLPVLNIRNNLFNLVRGLSPQGIDKAKRAILTTDTFPKELTIKFRLKKTDISLCGVAKGAGMISPHLATLLVFLFTDADITKTALSKALKEAVDLSFNCITVDGCMSTNDTVIILANGLAKNPLIREDSVDFLHFKDALRTLCSELAKLVIKDAEGGTKFIEIRVDKAKDYQEAKRVALSIANSNLFKTAIYGENPNFGRIVAAVGAVGIDIKEELLKIKVSPLDRKDIRVNVSLNRGKAEASVYTSDLTPKYIKINAEYS